MNLSHRIELDATFKQLAYFRRAAGTRRRVWNDALEAWEKQFVKASEAAEKAKTKTAQLTTDEAKDFVRAAVKAAGGWPSGRSLKVKFNKTKYKKYPWLKGVHRDAHSQPFTDIQDAFGRYRKKIASRPKFKKKGRSRDSFYVANDKLKIEGKKIRLPVIGWVRMREPLRFVGKIMSATVSRMADRWFVSISVETNDPRPVKLKTDGSPRRSAELLPETARHATVGVDLGLLHLAVTSAGVIYEAPKPLKKALEKLARLQRAQARKLSVSKKAKPDDKRYRSKNWLKGNKKLARLHARVSRVRVDFIHKMTTDLCRENQAIGGRGSERRRNAQEPLPLEVDLRRRLGRDPASATVQGSDLQHAAGSREPLLPVKQDVFVLQRREEDTRALRARVQVRGVWSCDRP